EVEFHPWRHSHPIELLLPVARGDEIIHQHYEADVHRLSPSHHDLPVHESIVDPVQFDRHAGLPRSTRIAAAPRRAASSAAATSVSSEPSASGTMPDVAKCSSAGRFAPVTTMMSGRTRRSLHAAKLQLPAGRSVKTTRAPVASIRSRSICSISF